MDKLNDFIHVYENALNSNICDFLVSFFDEVSYKHERYDNNGTPNFTQLNLTENLQLKSEIEVVHNHIIEKVFEYMEKYSQFMDKNFFPTEPGLEQFRIKKYNPGGKDRFDTHVDVVDYPSSRRFLSFFWYLNDVEQGGETVFKNLKIKPSKGKLVIFPPLWMFPHKGSPPISQAKYLLSTYLHYT
jgi:hypothetical protein